ncbi:Phosphoserine phosphatase [Taenia crassiceps]|uniref:Phosphoserine phosphatase n=1 Tax=Taenia crassiceps TaxID=6207 RepID=A0ABR4QJ90_9CEST
MPDLSQIKAVCFDVDSTVCLDDGIDMVAAYCNKGELVSQITTQAMDGTIDVTVALEQRLKILGLSKDLIRQFLNDTPLRLTPGIERLVASLRSSNVEVYLLFVPEDHVFSNRLIYNDDGVAVDFDRQQPTSRSDGKKEVVAAIKSKLSGESKTGGVLVVGDGVTDAAACPPADAFLGFGGVIARPSVQRTTPFFFHSFDEMHTFLQHCGLITHSS